MGSRHCQRQRQEEAGAGYGTGGVRGRELAAPEEEPWIGFATDIESWLASQ